MKSRYETEVERISDAVIIERSHPDPARFAALYDRHAMEIHRYAARRLGPQAADDITAEVFVAAFRRRDRYDLTCDDARPWLYGIATNLIGKHRRAEVRFFRAIACTPTWHPPLLVRWPRVVPECSPPSQAPTPREHVACGLVSPPPARWPSH
ncbi:RNA polymerase sigma factor [Sphaerisporangium fuscum]|uniref:RNA polymerase sigma factor n=1 Tax=Sphaerisporangium fuscum TaxID=2835868 RepID=UPI0027E26E9C|nr:RNA polymerase sigma factor [Sphaerisporangium fuscum]